MVVPIGASFKERGMRNDQHDAVAATFWIPYDFVPDAEPPQPRPPLKVALLSLPMMMMVLLNLSLPHLLLLSRRGLVRIPFETLEHMLMIGRLLHLSCFAPLMVA